MRKIGVFHLLATIMLLLFSCQQDLIDIEDGIDIEDRIDINDDIDDGFDDLSSETLAISASRSRNCSTVQIERASDELSPFIAVRGAYSKLRRSARGISANFNTKGLIPGNAYTLWWVILNDDGLGPPILVTRADGQIACENGNGYFCGHLRIGETFNTPLTAEVHLALRTHGPVQPDMMPEQIQMLDGGCTSGFPTGPGLHPDSDVVGYCANVQVAIHLGN